MRCVNHPPYNDSIKAIKTFLNYQNGNDEEKKVKCFQKKKRESKSELEYLLPVKQELHMKIIKDFSSKIIWIYSAKVRRKY
jgi:hypothetical protein